MYRIQYIIQWQDGSVEIKEMIFDKNISYEKARKYIIDMFYEDDAIIYYISPPLKVYRLTQKVMEANYKYIKEREEKENERDKKC